MNKNNRKKQKYSMFSIIKNSFSNHTKWNNAWINRSPKKSYDAIIVGGGGQEILNGVMLNGVSKIVAL